MPTEPKGHRTEILVAIISVSGVLGAALMANWDKLFPQPALVAPGVATRAVEPGTEPLSPRTVPAPAAPSAAALDISGVWRDVELGTTFQISQQGNSYSFAGSHPNFRTYGRGVISGHALESTYQNNYANGTILTGSCTGTVSRDGSQTASVCVDSMYGQRSSAVVR
jgi:hypothetical protein